MADADPDLAAEKVHAQLRSDVDALLAARAELAAVAAEGSPPLHAEDVPIEPDTDRESVERAPGPVVWLDLGQGGFDEEAALTALEAEDRGTPIALHCHHGGRSARAAQALIDLGFQEVYNVVGGIDAWSLTVDPAVPRY